MIKGSNTMKTIMIKIILVGLVTFSCVKNSTDPDDRIVPGKLEFKLDISSAPIEISYMEGFLYRDFSDTIDIEFNLQDTIATAFVEHVPSGPWTLLVNAYDAGEKLAYSGNTVVTVIPGETTPVNIHLDPLTGNLDIAVTWGEDKDLVAYYPFNSTANDESGNNLHGTVYGAMPAEDRFGNQNAALYFDGIDDYIMIPHNEVLNFNCLEDSYTLSVWVKSDEPSTGRIIIKWNEHIDIPYPFAICATSEKCNAAVFNGVEGEVNAIHFGNIWNGNWNHLVIVVDHKKMSFSGYLNKDLFDIKDITYTTSTKNNCDIYIALRPVHNDFYQGYIDDIKIYNYALSMEEILEL
jgi:hypothetical protein